MNHVSRRTALLSGFAIPAALSARSAEPFKVPGIKLSIAAYSYRKYLDAKNFNGENEKLAKAGKPKMPDSERMDYFQFAELAAGMGLGAIEVTSYYIPETTNAWLSKFKRHCTRLGLDISGMATSNDFCLPEDKLKGEIKKIKDWLAIASYLGAKTLRVFAGKTPKGDTEEAARQRCIACLKEVAEYAPQHGVVIAVENHGGIVETAEQILAVYEGAKHEWLGVNLDTGNFRTPDPYGDLAKVASHAVVVQMKTDVQPKGQLKKSEADFARLFGILRDAKYRGYVALEYEGAEEPKTAIPKYIKQLQQFVRT